MATCSICERPEAASIINELLEKKTALDVIAQQTGCHRSSVHRHAKKCFPAWRAARLKARSKNDGEPGRMIVQWPDRPDVGSHPHFSYFDRVLTETELRPDDIIFEVVYAEALVEQNFADAIAEDAFRSKAKAELSNNGNHALE
jgi:hypothetical protein